MDTKIIKIDTKIFDKDVKFYEAALNEAASVVNSGGLVVFPTETVYGLGADACNKEAAKKIYAAKNRPSDNPLIIHISCFEDIYKYAEDVSEDTVKLAKKFCPGPLTFILKKKDTIPYETSGGLDTVGIRIPSNKIAREFIRLSGTAIAAPSANISGRPSPTRFKHVFDDMYGRVDCIIDGGNSLIGLESSIVDMTGSYPVMLRPGAISMEDILEELGIDTDSYEKFIKLSVGSGEKPKAPGMKYRHYAPSTQVNIISGEYEDVFKGVYDLIIESSYKNIGLIICEESREKLSDLLKDNDEMIILSNEEDKLFFEFNKDNCKRKVYAFISGKRNDGGAIASNLFDILRKFDDIEALDEIYSEDIYANDMNMAIKDRLYKASGYNIKYIGR